MHLLGGTLRLRYKGWVRLKSTRELKQLSVEADAFELARRKTLAELYTSLGWGWIAWKERSRAGDTLRDEHVGQKLRPITSDTGPGVAIFLGDSESSTTSQQFPLTLIVIPRRTAAADAH